MSDLVGNPEERLSRDAAQMIAVNITVAHEPHLILAIITNQ